MMSEQNSEAGVLFASSRICPLRIICMSSMPERMMRAQRKLLNPIIGLMMRLMARWSCSTTLFRYFTCRIVMGVSRPALRDFSGFRRNRHVRVSWRV